MIKNLFLPTECKNKLFHFFLGSGHGNRCVDPDDKVDNRRYKSEKVYNFIRVHKHDGYNNGEDKVN